MADIIPIPTNHRFQDLTGKIFGRLGFVGQDSYRQSRWKCLCVCNNVTIVNGTHLKGGKITSCGCFATELIAARNRENATHGLTGTPEYRTWTAMKNRCNGNDHWSHIYIKKGIKICERWQDSFENFLADMGRRPTPNHSIDRINNDGDYEPDNCRWATKTQQSRNRNIVRQIAFNGEIHCVPEWAEIIGISEDVINNRLRHGWSIQKTLTHPVRCQKSLKDTHNSR